ncbi:hypothetical protein SAMN05445756_1295 [Kytococcus aerolatus]|uniref:Uncharacterized protein n=1 Tax=Kytococcus aerolatus TaxID=592308 RepID=A0A212THJ9_9MICO|nr:hypothetical protein SAMN05445756_1295 [Kytococcus aerolatus]
MRLIARGTALALAVCAGLVVPTHPAAAEGDDADPGVDLAISRVDPGWLTAGESGELTTTVEVPAGAAVEDLRVTFSSAPLIHGREETGRWLDHDGASPADRERLAVEELPAGGGERELRLPVEAPEVDEPAILPLVVAVSGRVDGRRTVLDAQRTAIPVLPEGAEETASPHRVGWFLPVTVPLTSDLFAGDRTDRQDAWSDAVTHSPSVQVADELGEQVTLAVDPALVSALPPERLQELGLDRRAWRLPRTDVRPVDLHPGADDSLWQNASRVLVKHPRPLVVDESPVSGRLGSGRELASWLDRSHGPRIVLAPSGFRGRSTTDSVDDRGNWWERSRVGWVDQELSHHLGASPDPADGSAEDPDDPEDDRGAAVPTQALLALTAATWAEEERDGEVVVRLDPTGPGGRALVAAVEAAGDAPWLEAVPASELLDCTAGDCGRAPADGSARWSSVEPRTPPHREELPAALEQQVTALAGSVEEDEATRLRDAVTAQASRRWTSPAEREEGRAGIDQSVRTLTEALDVEDSTVNLLADSATLRVTVANTGGTDFENLRVHISPGNNRATVEQPEERLSIRSRGTSNVSVTTHAHAIGQVPLRVTVTTADGSTVLSRGEVLVNARPADSWVYAGLGIVTALLIIVGVWRTVRRRPDHPEPGDTE